MSSPACGSPKDKITINTKRTTKGDLIVFSPVIWLKFFNGFCIVLQM